MSPQQLAGHPDPHGDGSGLAFDPRDRHAAMDECSMLTTPPWTRRRTAAYAIVAALVAFGVASELGARARTPNRRRSAMSGSTRRTLLGGPRSRPGSWRASCTRPGLSATPLSTSIGS
jgi:hypothetical protein